MAIPKSFEINLPLLNLLKDGKKHSRKETIESLAVHFNLTEEDRNQIVPSGSNKTFDTRVTWALSTLRNSLLLENTEWGVFKITKRGLGLLKTNPKKIDNQVLKQFPEFNAFMRSEVEELPKSEIKAPLEIIQTSYNSINQDLKLELQTYLRNISWNSFEKLVIDLIIKMGYGGTVEETFRSLKKSGDDGIDGVIKQDELGLDQIYLQAKHWTKKVGAPEIRNFIGALDIHNANKGIFLTNSEFTDEAIQTQQKSKHIIILIDGKKLTEYMIRYNMGVYTGETFEIKRIDTDFFEDL